MRDLLIADKYCIESELGSGGNGTVYAGTDTMTGEKVAIKLLRRSPVHLGIANEVRIFERLRMNYGMPAPVEGDNNDDDNNVPRPLPRKTMPEGFGKLQYWGTKDDYEVMVLDLLGPDLVTLWKYALRVGPEGNLPPVGLTPKTISMIGTQAILRLRTLHKEGVLHMDIKPENLLMGRGKKSNVLYIADFGSSARADGPRTFLHRQANEDLYQNPVDDIPFVGTDYYASLNVHLNEGYTYADDLESLLYTLLHLRMNTLPWYEFPDQGPAPAAFNNAATRHMKREMTPAQICAGAEPEFASFLAHVRLVRPGDMPNYARLTKLMQNLVTREGGKNDKVYDWTKTRYEDLQVLMGLREEDTDADENDDGDDE